MKLYNKEHFKTTANISDLEIIEREKKGLIGTPEINKQKYWKCVKIKWFV